jgi:hypothetical protein
LNHEWRNGNRAVIIGKLSLVEFTVNECAKFTESLDGRIMAKRFSDVVNLSSFVRPAGVRKKEYARHREDFGCDIEQCPLRLPPYSVELGFDKHPRPLPNRPSNNLLSAVLRNMRREYRKTRILGCAVQWTQWYINWLGIRNNTTAKRDYVGLNELWRSHARAT